MQTADKVLRYDKVNVLYYKYVAIFLLSISCINWSIFLYSLFNDRGSLVACDIYTCPLSSSAAYRSSLLHTGLLQCVSTDQIQWFKPTTRCLRGSSSKPLGYHGFLVLYTMALKNNTFNCEHPGLTT